ncbi:RNA-directed DNA polymerase, eukaryota, reverse transcriptase zinc-binding domain protein [Tanacetum coccineum]
MEEIKANLILRRKMLLIELQSINEQLRVLETPTTVIDVPESESLKTATSPVQTASGKDSTNPLKAEEQVFKPNYLQAAKSNQERFYVIYKGPRAGIYTNWGEVHRICQEDKSTNKKFSSLEHAQMEFHLHAITVKKTRTFRSYIRPKLVQKIEKIKEETSRSKNQDSDEPIGAASRLIYQAFQSRSRQTNIYPSNNLLELKEFPKPISEVIKHFRKKVLKAQDKPIYVKVVSSIPDWNHEENYSPYHFMEIGLAKPNKELQFSKVMEDKLENPFLEAVPPNKARNQDSHCIIVSHKASTEEDINLLNQFGLPFLKNTIEAKGTTKEAYCRQARQLFEEHSCNYCIESKEKEVGPSTSTKQVPTTEDESSSD